MEVSSDFINDDYKINVWKDSSMHLRKVYWKFLMTLLTTATLSKTLMKDSYSDLIRNIEKSVLEVSSIFIDDDDKIL